MPGSIQVNQPGGVGVVSGGLVSNGAACYPTFIGATTTTWTWTYTSNKPGSTQTMQRATQSNPQFTPDDDWPGLITFVDSNGVMYMCGIMATQAQDSGIETVYND